MLPNIGFSELIVILMILLLVFGASRLPQIGESLGRTVRGLKRGLTNDDRIEVRGDDKHSDAPPPSTAARSPAPSDAKSDISDAEIVDKKS